MQVAFDELDAPIRRVTAKDVPIPYTKVLEAAVLPDVAGSSPRSRTSATADPGMNVRHRVARPRSSPAMFCDRPLLETRPVPIEVKMAKLSPTMSSGQWSSGWSRSATRSRKGTRSPRSRPTRPSCRWSRSTRARSPSSLVEPGEEIAVGADVLLLATKGEDPKTIAGLRGIGPRGQDGRVGQGRLRRDQRRVGRSRPRAVSLPRTRSTRCERPGQVEPAGPQGRGRRGVDIGQVQGSGPGGRVVRSDVEALPQDQGLGARQVPGRPARRRVPPGRGRHRHPRSTASRRRSPPG